MVLVELTSVRFGKIHFPESETSLQQSALSVRHIKEAMPSPISVHATKLLLVKISSLRRRVTSAIC